LDFIVTTNAAALLTLVKKSIPYPAMTATLHAAHGRAVVLGEFRDSSLFDLRHTTGFRFAVSCRWYRNVDERLRPFVIQPRQWRVALMIRNKPLRRSLGALLVLLGALLIWLPYDLTSGIVLVLAGAVLELVGITLEKRDKQA
jgi:hypothetical protein